MECTIYSNTGFNAVNIPENSSLLPSASAIKTTTIDVLQNRFLSSVSVKTTWDAIKNADRVVVDGFHYIITGVTMTSYDVARLSLIPDFITSAGGVGALEILDGVTERVHVSKTNDTFGTYNEADPLITCVNPLELYTEGPLIISAGEHAQYINLVESTIDLFTLGSSDYSLEARTFSDGTNSVTTPSVPYVSESNYDHTAFYFGGLSTLTNGTCLFNVNNSQVQRGIQTARDLGIENGIIAQYTIPSDLFTFYYHGEVDGVVDSSYGTAIVLVVRENDSISGSPSGDNFKFSYSTVQNNRSLYGENNRYGLMSSTGSTIEFSPEEIYYTETPETIPSVVCHVDGRNDGRPYFSFRYFHNEDKTGSLASFFLNSISGMEWRNLPLTFVTKSGSIQDCFNFKSQRTEANATNTYNLQHYQNQQAQGLTNQIVNGIAGVAGVAGSIAKGDVSGAVSGAASTIGGQVNSVLQGIDLSNSEDAYRVQYAEQSARELYNFGYSQSVVTPQVMFPYQTPSVRDYMGNGVVVYRYRPSDNDLIRIDRLLTAYGYKYTKFLESSDFSTRSNFNYVKANGVSVGGNLPQWWKNGITAQFANGIRVWHVTPSYSYITERNNP